MSERGIGYEVNDVLTLSGLELQSGANASTSKLQVTVKNKYQDKFSGWAFNNF